MKRIMKLVVCLTMIINMFTQAVYADSSGELTAIEYLENGDYIETIICVRDIESSTTRSTSYTKSGTKTAYYKNSSGEQMWSVSVTGVFEYVPGSSSVCTSVSGSAEAYVSGWGVGAVTTSRRGDSATAYVTGTQYVLFLPVISKEVSVTISCDKYGNFH